MTASYPAAKRALQIAVIIGGLVPVSAGLAGILFGPQMVSGVDDAITSVSLDSHYRYLSGLLLGIGLMFWYVVPRIESRGIAFRMLATVVFIGGAGRLCSLLLVGAPDMPMRLALGMEMVVVPLLALWQYRIAKKSGNP